MKKRKYKKQANRPKTFLELLTETPSASQQDKHYWADFIELKCLVNRDYQFSQAEFQDVCKENKDLLPKEKEESETEYISKGDRSEVFAQDCFDLIRSREKIFSNYYPFKLPESKKILIRKQKITLKHKLYLFFLFCSTLNYTKSYLKALTDSFEMLGKEVFKNLLPEGAEVHLFGSGNSIEKNKRYSGNVLKKIELLAKDLFEFSKVDQSNFAPTNVGDEGLDIVGWLPNGPHDNQPHLLTFFGQSACTPDWVNKQHSSSFDAWSPKINLSVRPVNIILCPYSFRSSSGEWHGAHEIAGSLMLDRQRLIHHFQDNFKEFKKWPSRNVVENLIKEVEPIF